MSTRAFVFAMLLVSICFSPAALRAADPTTRDGAEIPIGGDGRWDYVSFDSSSTLLYITRSTHVQIFDPKQRIVVGDIEFGGGLHGTAIVPSVGRGFTTDGEGFIHVFDAKSRAVLGKIPAAPDADGIIYDSSSDRILVSCGDAGQLLVLDPHAEVASAKCKSVELGGKPEFLAADGHGKAFVCINDKNEIAVVDLSALKVVARWPISDGTSPTGMTIDPAKGRLFVGCRNEKLIVLDSTSGKVLANLPIGKGNDACAFDPGLGEAFASCGDGTVAAVKETAPDKYEVVRTIHTAQGARTMAVDPATHTLFLPTSDFDAPKAGQRRPAMKPGTFKLLMFAAEK